MVVVLTFLLLILASAECRQMCYSCQYTITSTKQGIECSEHFNETSKMYRCSFSCLIRTLRNTATQEITSAFRGCAAPESSGCLDINGVTRCSYTCNKDLCNTMSIDKLEEKYGLKNGTNVIYGNNFIIVITFLILNCISLLKLS
ncbi:uncharacterized protein LOC106874799 isoform X2 [Octopus bimaculoides]|uniref:UPAR/Ly6 domain-containing protein n=1 Tax=Octopus bimaculoides TaxID=37653 RepID=A0A0L8GT88_OCTBM|nr:uncharacterized protein LOC106874799 isoform X2 [Octopus bimaculoides]|eukprot:XP_014778141.1 PREDICTED: uncharacterized protein LOC106874799 [Octopus bimaculoides]